MVPVFSQDDREKIIYITLVVIMPPHVPHGCPIDVRLKP